jgi:hypothetical protein
VANWWITQSGGEPGPVSPGGTTTGGGGRSGARAGSAGALQYRSPLDAARASQGRIPQAEYPDGYLGTIIDRHQDKLLENVQEKLTQRSYQRGVHKGAKIDASDYFWAGKSINPDMMLIAESKAVVHNGLMYVDRFCPTGNPVERLAHLGKTAGLSPPEQVQLYKQYGVSVAKNPVVLTDPDSVARKQKMLPRYAM